jgi:Protein of unknown function (DUF2971)
MTNDIPPFPPEQERFLRILHPYALDQHLRAVSQRTRFVHYTSADTAMSILRSREVWMRKSSCMNDFLEVQYGLARLGRAYGKTDAGAKFQSNLNSMFDGITADIEKLFDSWTPHFHSNTYLACLSEHDDREDTFGRLSMWRAYCETAGVALVLNNSAFLTPALPDGGLRAYTSPVAYLDDGQFENEVGKIAKNIADNADFLKTLGREAMISRIFNMFRFAVLCTKHPGFAEEKEWRVIYSPAVELSPYLTKDIQVVKGVPQPIYKIPLKDIPEIGLAAAIPTLLNRVIIGPTEYPLVLHEAFVDLLTEAGVQDPAAKV